jgi:intracellular sulfur oxidation DsrE/DsrF family protein
MRQPLAFLAICLLPSVAFAGPDNFKIGPVFEAFGPVATVPDAQALPASSEFKISFDTAKASEGEALNRTLESAARFINMHAAAGVDPDNVDVAVIVHGGAAFDLLTAEPFAARRDGAANPNAALINALTDHGVRIILCGQTAAYRDISADDLLPGVEMALSAMTAHAQLQQAGYTLNPF